MGTSIDSPCLYVSSNICIFSIFGLFGSINLINWSTFASASWGPVSSASVLHVALGDSLSLSLFSLLFIAFAIYLRTRRGLTTFLAPKNSIDSVIEFSIYSFLTSYDMLDLSLPYNSAKLLCLLRCCFSINIDSAFSIRKLINSSFYLYWFIFKLMEDAHSFMPTVPLLWQLLSAMFYVLDKSFGLNCNFINWSIFSFSQRWSVSIIALVLPLNLRHYSLHRNFALKLVSLFRFDSTSCDFINLKLSAESFRYFIISISFRFCDSKLTIYWLFTNSILFSMIKYLLRCKAFECSLNYGDICVLGNET